MTRLFSWVFLAGLWAGCLAGCADAESALGPDFTQVLRTVGSGQSYRLLSVYDKGEQETGELFMAYKVIRHGPRLGSSRVRELFDLIYDSGSHRWAQTKGRLFAPEIAIRFKKGGKTADVLIDLNSSQWAFYVDEQRVHFNDFSPARDRVLAFAKGLFPSDDLVN